MVPLPVSLGSTYNPAAPVPNGGTTITVGAAGSQAILVGEAANVLAQRNGTFAQKLIVYTTYTDASNYRRLVFDAQSANPQIILQSAGTGGNAPLYFWNGTAGFVSLGTSNTERWQITSSGHLMAGADSTYDIGASAATRPRDIYLGRNFTMGGAESITPANGGALATGGTIATANSGCSRVQPAAAVTGVILAAGTVDGQLFTVINEAAAANTITFAAAGTSNVADGVSSVIAGLNARTFQWTTASARWFPIK